MLSIKELEVKKQEIEERKILPIQDLESLIDSHIETTKKLVKYERALLSIYNVDAMFLVGDTEGEYDVQKAHDDMLNTAAKALI